MDSLTHIVVGACFGEAVAGKTLGKKAMFWGALMHSLPDIDFVTSFWMSLTDSLLAHRAITHSLFFIFLIPVPLLWIARRIHSKGNQLSFLKWYVFFSSAIALHVFIDIMNNYGVALFAPFSEQRYSLNALYVADPLFTIGPLVACFMLLILKRNALHRMKWWRGGLMMAGVYIIYALFNKWQIGESVQKSLALEGNKDLSYFSTPAPLQSWLWFITVRDRNQLKIAYRSVFDKKKEINWRTIPVNMALYDASPNKPETDKLIKFSDGFYSFEYYGDTLVFNDFRFGQEVGWHDSLGKIAFHYYLNYPEANDLVVQRGRFARWNKTILLDYFKRIFGKIN